VTESELPPEEAADDVTVGAWLDTETPSIVEPPSLVSEPVETPSLWDRIKRALGTKT
jgi:hypothetical protein